MQNDPLFDTALKAVLAHEGGFSDDAGDPGGATNFGISLRLALTIGDTDGDGILDLDVDGNGYIDANDIRRLTPEAAARVYRTQWWDKYGYGRFHPTVAVKIFDLSVNVGAPQAHKILQRAVRAASGNALNDDGALGPKTVEAVSACEPPILLVALRAEAAGFYRSLVSTKPTLAKFLGGWLNRAYS